MKRINYLFISMLVSLFACTDKPLVVSEDEVLSLPSQPYDYQNLQLPVGTSANFSIFSNFDLVNGEVLFSSNKLDITQWGATLGRVLFYDKKLSLNNTVSCGSCHHQDKGFADGLQFSTGFEGRVTTRNSMAIVNPILQNNLFWDSRSKTIHDLSLQPVQNHIEMGMENLDRLVEKIEKTDYYKPLFEKAFGTDVVTPENISKALSQFVGSITSNRSKFDKGLTNNFNEFTELEKLGKEIFNGKGQCASCHGGNSFSALDGPNDPYGGGGGTFSIAANDLRGATNISNIGIF